MKHAILKHNVIIAIFSCKEDAHIAAESLCYAWHRNAIYGLFNMEVISLDELSSTKEGKQAHLSWHGMK